MVTREQVLHVAQLAALELAPDELERLAPQLAAILEYVNQLRELDDATAGEPRSPEAKGGGPRPTTLRSDDPHATLPHAAVIALFPQSDGSHALVPPVLPPRKNP